MYFFQGFAEIQNGRHRLTTFFVGAKTQKLSQKLF